LHNNHKNTKQSQNKISWGSLTAEIFLMENPVIEWVMLGVGVVQLVLSFGVVWWAIRWVSERFKGT
jgi:hypothetical protein